MKRLTLLSVSIVLLTNLIYSQSIEIKDSGDQLLLQVNDEGADKSSITIPSSTSAPTSSANKLYNQGGSLKWNGTTLATGSLLWSLNGEDVYRATGKVGIGVSTPTRTLEVRGPWQTARISSTSSGASLEFVSTTANDWAITTWNGNLAFLNSTNDFDSKTDEYYFTTSAFYPFSNNARTLGTSSKRWSNLHSIDGTFSGQVGIGTATPSTKLEVNGTVKITDEFEINTAGVTIKSNGTEIQLISKPTNTKIIINNKGITIDSNTSIDINATGNLNLSGLDINLVATNKIALNAPIVDIDAASITDIDAGLITLNNGGTPAARVGDLVQTPGGITGSIITGSPTVLIGN